MRLRTAFLWKQRLRLGLYLGLLVYWTVQWSNAVSLYSPYDDSSLTAIIDPPQQSIDGAGSTSTILLQEEQLNQHLQSLPQWMNEYFQWHSQQLPTILQHQQNSTWQNHRLLIVRCMDNDRCGGTSDRLKSVPLFLALAYKSKRLLFLRWNRPFPLEEFLVPRSFWNWTVPTSLATTISDGTSYKNQTTILSKKSQQLVSAVHNPSTWLVQGNLQFSGANLYDTLVREFHHGDDSMDDNFVSLYHSFFHVSFAPSPAIQEIVKDVQLTPNHYVVVHIRAKYPGEVFRETGNLTALQDLVNNAICVAAESTSYTRNKLPIYLASDTLAVLQAGQKYYNPNAAVVSRLTLPQKDSRNDGDDPPHLNFAQRDDPSAFYSIFVDLIIMSQSQCVFFGAGGFGRFGSLVSYNVSCRQAHSIKGVMQDCNSSSRY